MTLRGLTQIQMDTTITNVGGIETGTDNFNHVFQVNERLTWLRGRHTMKFGGSWNYYRSKSYCPGNNGHNGFIWYTLFNFTGYPFADFLLDQVSRKGRGSTSDAWTHLQHRAAAFASDNFKIGQNLTLNLGLRWAYTSPLVEKDIGRRISISRTRRSSSPGAMATAARYTTRSTTVGNPGSGSPTAKVRAGCSAAATG